MRQTLTKLGSFHVPVCWYGMNDIDGFGVAGGVGLLVSAYSKSRSGSAMFGFEQFALEWLDKARFLLRRGVGDTRLDPGPGSRV